MLCDWVDILAQLRYYEDLRREVEKQRPVRRALAERRRQRDRLHRRALTWLGQRLVTWGKHLQEHVTTPTAPPTAGRRSHSTSQ